MQDYHARPLEVIHTIADRLRGLELTADADIDRLLSIYSRLSRNKPVDASLELLDNEEVQALFSELEGFWVAIFEPHGYDAIDWVNDLKTLVKEGPDGEEQGAEEETA